jgi:hypothetical protein
MNHNTLELAQNPCCATYFDLKSHEDEKTQYFFLEKLLNARIEMHLDTGRHGFDEETNVYLADLMQSLFNSDILLHEKPYLSPFDFEVRKYLEEHPGLRTEYTVYKDNADFGLVSCGIFTDYEHEGSYHQHILADTDASSRIGFYYRIAGESLIHLRGGHDTLAQVLIEIGENITDAIALLRKVSGDYFEILDRISEGSMFHLQKEVTTLAEKKLFSARLDDFLKTFADYKRSPEPGLKESLLCTGRELARLNPEFHFDEKHLNAGHC